MDELEAIERLAFRARHERPPAGDVAAAVMWRLRTQRPASLLPLWVVAAVSSLAAGVVLALVLQAGSAGVDPHAAFYTVVEATQP